MKRGILLATTAVMTTLVTLPIAWLVSAAFKPATEIVNHPSRFLPQSPILGNFAEVFADGSVVKALLNSLQVAVPTTLAATCGAALLAFFSALHPRWDRALSRLALFAYVVPPVIVAVPIFVVLSAARSELIGTLTAVALAHVGLLLPFTYWLILARAREFPSALAESVTLDGGSTWDVLRFAWFPFLKVHLANVAVLAFSVSMNDYVFARFLLLGTVETLPLAIQRVYEMPSKDWGVIAAASTLAVLLVTIPTASAVIIAGQHEVAGHRG